MRSYWLAITISLLGHSVLVWLVVWGWNASSQPFIVKPPSYIKATLVSVEQKVKPASEKKPSPPKLNNDKKRAEEKKRNEQKRIAEQQLKKQLEKKRKKEEQAKKAEQERKNQLSKKRAEEKQKAEAEKKEYARQQVLEKQQEEQRKKQEFQEELKRELNLEQARLAEVQQAAQDSELVKSYNSIINERVSQQWSRPPSARNGMSVVLRIQLVPTGNVISVETITSSGDSAFDRSAEQAVKKAEKFPELREISTLLFERYYRNFNLHFIPEDLRQ